MAIQLPGTPQQQKAQFSAFDTSSNFQSGLTKVGQALQQVGAGQVRIKQREEEEIERKEKAGQQMLAIESEEQFSKELNSLKQTMESAFNTGDLNTISNLEKQLSAFDPSGANFKINNFAPQNRRSDLTNEEYTRRAAVNMSKEYRRVSSALKSKRVLSETYQRTVDYTQQQSLAAMTHIKDNEGGVSNENLVAAIDSMAFNSKSQVVRNGTTVGQPRVIFDASVKSNIRKLMLHQFDNTEPLSEDELKSRMEGIRDIFGDPRYKDAGIVLDADDFKAVTEAYNKKLGVVSDKTYQSGVATETVKNATSSVNVVMGATLVEQGDVSKIRARLATVDPKVLSPANQLKYESLSQLTSLFASPSPEYVDDFLEFEEGAKLASFDREAAQKTYNAFATDSSSPTHHDLLTQETPLAYSILEHVALQPKGEGYKVEDALKQLFTDDFSDITLAPTELSTFSEWVNRNAELLRDVGDNPTNIRVLSPELNELVKKAQSGDKEAWLLAENAYKDFVNSSPDLKSEAPPMFYTTRVELPTKMGNEETYVKGTTTNVVSNGPYNTISHASHRLAQGDISNAELLRYRVEMASAEAVLRSGAVTLAQQENVANDAALEMVALYKSGGEPSKQVDDLVEIIKAQDNKYERDDSGNVISILSLASTHTDTLDPSQEEFYNQIFRGAVKLNLGTLLKKDDPEEQHALIRDLFFGTKVRDVFPLVAASESGSLIEIPQELNHYIDEAKDRTGFFGRLYYGVPKMFSSEKESIKTVSSVYTGAAFAEFIDQYPSLNVEKIYRDIEALARAELGDDSEEESPSWTAGPDYVSDVFIGYKSPSEGANQKRTYRAMLRKMMNVQVKDKPVLKLVTEIHKDEDGNPQKVAVMKILNSKLKYITLPISETDNRPIAVPVSKITAVVDKIMPTLTDFRPTDLIGANPYFWVQLVNNEEGMLYNQAYEAHDKMYGATTEITEED